MNMCGGEGRAWLAMSSTIRTRGHLSACDDKRTADGHWHHVRHYSPGGAAAMAGDDVTTTWVSQLKLSFVHR